MRHPWLPRAVIALLIAYLAWASLSFLQRKRDLAAINQQIANYDTLLDDQRMSSLITYHASWDAVIAELEAASQAAPDDRLALNYHFGLAYELAFKQDNAIDTALSINSDRMQMLNKSGQASETHIYDALYAYLNALEEYKKLIDQGQVSAEDIRRDLALLIQDTRVIQGLFTPAEFLAHPLVKDKQGVVEHCPGYAFPLLRKEICK